MKKRLLIYSAIFLAALQAVWAEPYIAVRTGFKCSQCHVNRTGGGKRTEYGFVYSEYKLMVQSALSEAQPYSFDPKLNKSISVGANLRVYQSRLLSYDWDSTSANNNKSVHLPSSDNALINEANLYVQFDAIKNFLTVYLDQTMAPSSANREFWGMVQLPWNSYVKFGNMLLPYGYRLMDDQAFVRATTGYTYGLSGVGYEVGFEPGPLSLVVNMTPLRLSSVGSLVFNNMPVIRTFRVGGSYGTALKKAERHKDNAKGAFAGFSLGMFTVLGERDFVRKDTVDEVADYGELDFLPLQGLNFKMAYEYLWPNKNIDAGRNGDRRLVFGVEPFVMQFLQLGLYYRKNDGPPQTGNRNQDEYIGRLHAFF